MNVRSWKIRAAGGLEAIDPESALSSREGDQATLWVDISGFEPHEIDAVLEDLDASETTRQCCLALGEAPRIVPVDEAVFFEFPVFPDGTKVRPEELGFLCRDGLVLTLHRAPVAELEKVAVALQSAEGTKTKSAAGLVTAILISLTGQVNQIAYTLRDRVYALDDRMERAIDDVDADAILESKRAVRNLDTVVDEQLGIFGVVGALRRPFLDMTAFSESFKVMARTMVFAQRAVDRLEKHLSDLQDRYDGSRQEKINQRLAVLTVISAIFLPLTLVTGIYGMNFDRMPELHLSYGYPAAIGAMVTIAGGMYWFFRSRGWLD